MGENSNTALAISKRDTQLAQSSGGWMTAEKIAIIRRLVAKDTTDDEFEIFIARCQQTGLDAISKQIYCIKRKGQMTIQVSIDGLRLIAERTGEYQGQIGPYWCGEDGKWVDIWLKKDPPSGAKVGVCRRGFSEPLWGVAAYKSYVQIYEGRPQGQWGSMPDVMIAKCAESLALRKAFPQDTSGLYTTEEMTQADNEQRDLREIRDVTPAPKSAPAPAPARKVEALTGEIIDPPSKKPAPWDLFAEKVIGRLAGIDCGPETQGVVLAAIQQRMEAQGTTSDTEALQAMWKRVGACRSPEAALTLADELRPAVVPVKVGNLGDGLFDPEGEEDGGGQ